MAPAVSVLLPVRDAAPTLRTCLRSIERQTCADFEIVAVDDGSADGTAEILRRWRRRDERLRVITTAARGLVPALNQGLAECRADYVARMDGDDAMLPGRLERQLDLLRGRPGIDVASCLVRCFPRRRVAGGFRYYEAWLNSLTEPEDLYRERFVACKAHFLARGPLAQETLSPDADGAGPPFVVWGAGQTGRRLVKALAAEDRRPYAFVDIDPKKIGRAPYGVPVHDADALTGLLRPDAVVLVAVSRRGARDLIRPRLAAAGLVEGRSAFFVA